MNLKIKLVDNNLPLPQYQTDGSVAFDLYSRENKSIEPWKPTIVPANIIVQVPEGYFLMITSRSSLAIKKNLILANGVGVVDQDYCGDQDEIGVSLINFSNTSVLVERGERIAQALLVSIAKIKGFETVENMGAHSRGGFGSTGSHTL